MDSFHVIGSVGPLVYGVRLLDRLPVMRNAITFNLDIFHVLEKTLQQNEITLSAPRADLAAPISRTRTAISTILTEGARLHVSLEPDTTACRALASARTRVCQFLLKCEI